jgi:hypothetical protein
VFFVVASLTLATPAWAQDNETVTVAPTRPPAAQLVGMTHAALRGELGESTGRDAGWIRFGPHVAVKMARGHAARVIVRVPSGLECTETAVREGFSDAGAPLRRRDTCEWPAISQRHHLDAQGRFAGRLDLRAGTLEVWEW